MDLSQFGDFMSNAGAQTLASGAQSLVSGLTNQLFAGWQARRDYKYFKKKMNFQNDMAIDNWNRENEYNSPTAQVERLKEAGLAPEMAYDGAGGASGVSADLGGAQPSGGAPNSSMSVSPLDAAGIQSTLSDARLKDAQAQWYLKHTDTENFVQDALESETRVRNATEWLITQQATNERLKSDLLTCERDMNFAMRSAMAQRYKVKFYDDKGNPLDFEGNSYEIKAFSSVLSTTMNALNLYKDQKTLNQWFQGVSEQLQYLGQMIRIAKGQAGIVEIEEELAEKAKEYREKTTKEEWKRFEEYVRRYMNKEFDGSTTEWLMSCVNGTANLINAGANAYGAAMTGGMSSVAQKPLSPPRYSAPPEYLGIPDF